MGRVRWKGVHSFLFPSSSARFLFPLSLASPHHRGLRWGKWWYWVIALIRHFRVPPDLCIKTRLSAQLLIWKWFFIAMQVILIFTNVHLTSFESDVFWNSAGGGLFTWLLRWLLQTQTTWLKTRQVRSCHSGVGSGAGDYPAYYENDHQLLIWETKGTS